MDVVHRFGHFGQGFVADTRVRPARGYILVGFCAVTRRQHPCYTESAPQALTPVMRPKPEPVMRGTLSAS